jgi:glycosyltransferase involved in cell wall biosynthesis
VDIALIGEGTYPYHFGGVSVWCDQLIRGMPEYSFQVLALVATGKEQVSWELPDNVSSVTGIAMWGQSRPPSARRRMSSELRSEVIRLVEVMMSPPDENQARFRDVLRAMYEIAKTEDLSAGLASEEAMGILADSWREREQIESGQSAPTLHDAVTAMQLLEHSLRPLSGKPVKADVAHAVTNGLGALPALISKWEYGTPILVTEHGIYIREQYLHNRNSPFRWPVKSLYLSFLRRICALGYDEAETIAPGNIYNIRWQKRLGADPDRVRTVYNGVNPSEFPLVVDEPEVPTISWAGRVDPIKDIETLLRAFPAVRQKLPEVRLRLFGSPPPGREAYLDRCKALAITLGIDDAVSFEGRVDDIRDAYVAGHIVVLCSVAEGFPYTVIEAMTCGRACVATDVGGVNEAIGDTGIVVPPRNPAALAAACIKLLKSDASRRRLGAKARLRALEYFTVDRAISAYDEIYSFLGSGYRLPIGPDDSDDEDANPGDRSPTPADEAGTTPKNQVSRGLDAPGERLALEATA